MTVLGLDIGTTTICAAAVDSQTGQVLRSMTVANDTFIPGKKYEKIQNPDETIKKALQLCDELTEQYNIGAIGITGQMHGILYLDSDGAAVSPLYTWQDQSGNELFGGSTFADTLKELTGCNVASGFGSVTYFMHSRTGAVPKEAVRFCTVHDYAAMKLTGRKTPLTHISDAASFGLFDLKENVFDKKAVAEAGLSFDFYPEVTKALAVVGEYKGIPVTVAVGDNQASFIGSVRNSSEGVLINVGTGGQISMETDAVTAPRGMEIRPLYDDKRLLVYCSLCGGRAFALLADFMKECVKALTGQAPENVYKAMDGVLSSYSGAGGLTVSTLFSGTREDPAARGKIEGISVDNFTPANLMYAFVDGIARELIGAMPKGFKPKTAVGSGNGVRKNPALQRVISQKLSLPLMIPAFAEEAAFGAALCAMAACGEKKDVAEAQKLIGYE